MRIKRVVLRLAVAAMASAFAIATVTLSPNIYYW